MSGTIKLLSVRGTGEVAVRLMQWTISVSWGRRTLRTLLLKLVFLPGLALLPAHATAPSIEQGPSESEEALICSGESIGKEVKVVVSLHCSRT